MRIATAQAYENSIANLQKRYQDMSDAQERLTSGKRVLRASDDPTAAARAERALAVSERAEVSQRAVEASRTSMELSESALGDAVKALQSAREGVVAAGNASYTDAERQGLAQQLELYRNQLLTIANRDDGAGRYLFAGQGSQGVPFVDTSTGVQFRGLDGETSVTAGENLPVTVNGATAWMRAPTGNGVFETQVITDNGTAWIDVGQVSDPAAIQDRRYDITFSVAAGVTSYSVQRRFLSGLPDGAPVTAPYQSGTAIEIDGMSVTVNGSPANGDEFRTVPSTQTLSVFDALDRTVAALREPFVHSSDVAQTVAHSLRDIDSVLGRLQSVRSAVGDTLNRIENATDRLDATTLHAKTERSNAEDLDMVQGISDFQNKQSGYDAVLKTYAQVQRLSLFQYLG
jgi:flagellar hook-associated protein 3 FlgL